VGRVPRTTDTIQRRSLFVGIKGVTHLADGDSMSSLIDRARDARLAALQQETLRRRATDSVVAGTIGPARRRREGDAWLERWIETVADLARLKRTHPMLDAVIDEQDGRRIRIGDRWLFDFASCNYLGFDLDPEIIETVPEYLARWGTHPSWSRLLGSPVLYEEIEERVTELVGGEDTLLLPTITHIHMSVIPVLVGAGAIFLDGRAHKTIYDGAMIAKGHGATVERFRHDDPEHLESLLRSSAITPRVIALDGVNSMLGTAPDLRAFARLARENDALLYVDDAHGFGVVGQRSSNELCDWGTRGNGIVRHQGETYENVIFVAGFSKAYSSLLSFLTLPTRLKDVLKVAAPPYLYSGPSPVASLATTIAGLDVNERRGDEVRFDTHRKTARVLERIHELGIYTPNHSGYPLIEIPLADHEDIDEVGRYLFDRGLYVTMAAYPLVPKDEVGFRIQITAANDDEQIERLIEALGEINERFELQHDGHRELLRERAARRGGTTS
jgi:8-amino-7-oxononanoate synthase